MIMNMVDMLDDIQTRADLIRFINALEQNCQSNPEDWENTTVPAFLTAMSAWLDDADGYYENRGQPSPPSPSWKLVGEMLFSASAYE